MFEYLIIAFLLVLISDAIQYVFYWGQFLGGLLRDLFVEWAFLPSDFWEGVDND